MRARRRQELKDRFGSEYDRVVEDADTRRDAERDLRERAARRDERRDDADTIGELRATGEYDLFVRCPYEAPCAEIERP